MSVSYVLRKLRGLGRLLRDRICFVPSLLASMVIPRDPRLWVFGSWHGSRFADNPKHLFLQCHAHRWPVRAIWISANQAVVEQVRALGLPAFHRWSMEGWWHALRAGAYVFDCRVADINGMASRGALRVNLWHGVPLKKIENDIEQADHELVQARRGPAWARLWYKLLRPEYTERYDLVLATGPAAAQRIATAFDLPSHRILTAGYPRTDALLDSAAAERWLTSDERSIAADWDALRGRGQRILLYMPTFRDWNNQGTRSIPIDWRAMNATLTAEGGVLYCKLHPNDCSSLPSLEGCDRIHLLPNGIDMYPLLARTDALVTDYSSIFFDYLLLDRPIVFYAYDLEEYQQRSRSMYDSYEAVTPGQRVTTSLALEDAFTTLLRDYQGECDRWRSARDTVRSRFFSHVKAGAGERLYTALLQQVVR